jgi:hypothetical protein
LRKPNTPLLGNRKKNEKLVKYEGAGSRREMGV